MISLTNHHLWWGRSEVVIIYPDSCQFFDASAGLYDRQKIRHHCQIHASLLWWTGIQAKDQASLPNSCQSSLMPQLFQCCWLLKTIQWPNIHTSNISKRLKDQKPGSDIQSIKTKQYKDNTIYIYIYITIKYIIIYK